MRLKGPLVTLSTLLLSSYSPLVYTAEKTSLRQQFSASKSAGPSLLGVSHQTFRQRLELDDLNHLEPIKQMALPSGLKHRRLQQHYQGIPIWGEHLTLTEDVKNKIVLAHGNLYRKFQKDLDRQISSRRIKPEEALQHAINYHLPTPGKIHHDRVISEKSSNLNIVINDDQSAQLIYVVTFFSETTQGGEPRKPITFVNANTGEILRSWNGLNHLEAQGPGGNEKTGIYYYGTDLPPFEVNDQCEMLTPQVKTMDFSDITTGNVAFRFACLENTHKAVNGAFAPLNDAHFFSNQVFSMFQDVYEVPVLEQQLTVRVHYGNNYQNAFYSGNTISLGDGAFTLHPLTSLDIIAHEISHGFTENHSRLIYTGQSGAINESFSDMAGEAAEFYVFGENDFLVGEAVRKSEGGLRDLANPSNDGRSLDHVDNYIDGYNIHYASGIFNKVFYSIATANDDWDTLKAFEIFVYANRFYWSPSVNFEDAACGVVDAAFQLGYDTNVVSNAFSIVGIETCTPGPKAPIAEFTATVDGLDVSFVNLSRDIDGTVVEYFWDFGDGGTSNQPFPQYSYNSEGEYLVSLTVTDNDGLSTSFDLAVTVEASGDDQALRNGEARPALQAFRREEQHFYIDVPEGATNLNIATAGGTGDVDLYVRFGEEATKRHFDCRPYLSGNNETCEFSAPQAGRYWVMLRAYRDFANVSLVASYDGGGEGDNNNGDDLSNNTVTPIPDNDMSGIATSITVNDETGYATAQVFVNIEHTYVGDLIIDLIAPDGTIYNLHNRGGGSAQNISETYNISLGNNSVQGQWQLRVRDMAFMDTGTLLGWGLIFP